MNKSISAWGVLVLGLLMIAFLAGCGGVSAKTPKPTPTPMPTPPGATPTPTPAAAHGTFVYFDSGSSQVIGHKLNPDGTLTPLAGSPFAINGGLAAAGNFLAVSSLSTVSTYLVDASSGALTLSGTGTVNGNLAIAADSKNVYVAGSIPANTSTGIYGFALAANGALTPLAGSPYVFTAACDLCDAPFALTLNNSFLVQGGTGFHGVGDFTVYPRATGGVLGKAQILGTTALENVAIQHPTGSFAYALDTGDGLLSQFTISPGGQAAQTATLGFAGFPQALIVDTTGKFVLSLDNEGVVHVFAIASGSGNVSEIGRSDSGGSNAGGIAMEPGGHFVFVSAGGTLNVPGATNQITVFTFDPLTGAMKKLQSYPQPNSPGTPVVISR
jgi:hypothetical protein